MIFQKNILDTPQRKIVAYCFVLYYPIMSLLVSAPIPFPSLLEISPEQIALFNFVSLLVTIIGSSVGIYFSLDKKSVNRFEDQNKKIDKLDEKVDEKAGWLHKEIKEMESRICSSMSSKNVDIEKNMETKITSAKELVDTRFRHMEETDKGMQKSIDFLNQFQWGSGSKSMPPYTQGNIESQKHKDQPFEGMYHSPDSSETQQTKDENDTTRERKSKSRWEKDYNDNR